MTIQLPYAGIVLCIGPSNSGKSTLLKQWVAERMISQDEIVSSDTCRLQVSGKLFIQSTHEDIQKQAYLREEYAQISEQAFRLMETLAEARLKLGKLVIIDATNLTAMDRERYRKLSRRYHLPFYGLLFNVSEDELLSRDERREHARGKRRIQTQVRQLKNEMRKIEMEEFDALYTIKSGHEVVLRTTSPFTLPIGEGLDVIGDIHGCMDEWIELLDKLGYQKGIDELYRHPQGRKLLSLGDVMSRGPRSLDAMLFFEAHIHAGLAYMIDSNHGWKIARWLDGRKVTLAHGDENVEEEFIEYEKQHGKEETRELKERMKKLLLDAPSHYIIEEQGVPLAVAVHAGIHDSFIGRHSERVADFCRYGPVVGVQPNGKPKRGDWTIEHTLPVLVIWGHDPRPVPVEIQRTINIDQGAVFGGKLTALRLPSKEIVQVGAKDYAKSPINPLDEWFEKRLKPPAIQKWLDGFTAKTERGAVRIAGQQVKTALDHFSHATLPLEQLVYLPPTMSPPPVSELPDYLEHPEEAIAYYQKLGISDLIVEKKHMGSRAIILVFRSQEAALKWTGYADTVVTTSRTGRDFFDGNLKTKMHERIHDAVTKAGYFEEFETEWLLLDAEILPWNVKAGELIASEYAHVANAAIIDRSSLANALSEAATVDVDDWRQEAEKGLRDAEAFRNAYAPYIWSVQNDDAIQIAVFHVLAHQQELLTTKPHSWHMEQSQRLADASDLFLATEYRFISGEQGKQEAIQWWHELTETGGEGFVVKPLDWNAVSTNGRPVQPAMKVRGREYLRLIYGMNYLEPEVLEHVKKRGLKKKQQMAVDEYALGLEGIQRLIHQESVERIHECVLAVMAIESDPADPRL